MNPALYMGFPPILINSLDTALLATSITSTGKGNLPNFLTCFDSSTIQINLSDEFARIFSLVNAPPPPFINSFRSLNSSAPSI